MNIRFAVVAAASALATLPSWAQGFQVGAATNISISGLFAVGLKNSEVSQGNAATARAGLATETRIDDNTSRLIISSNSKITDGWNMIFRVESRFTADVRPNNPIAPGLTNTTGDTSGWADGDTWGGVASPWGSLVFGKSMIYCTDTISVGYLAPSLEAPGEGQRIWDANGLATFNLLDSCPTITKTNAVANASTTGITRSQNILRFDSVPVKGLGGVFDFALAWSKNAAATENQYPGIVTPNGTTYSESYAAGGTTYARARYNGNGVSALFAYLNQKVNGGTQNLAAYTGPLNTTAYRLGVSYKLPVGVKIGVVYDNTQIDNAVSGGAAFGAQAGAAKRSAFEIPVSYNWGDHGVYLAYTKAGDVSSASDSGARQLNLGYDYALTKRAFVGIFYAKLDNAKNGHYGPFLAGTTFGPTALATGESWRQIGINLNYWF